MKKRDKSGQFYLAAAVIIAIVIIGIITVTNYSTKKTPSKLNSIKQELKTEASKVLEYQSISQEDKIEEFTKNYSDYIGDQIEIIFIEGKYGITGGGEIEVYKYDGDFKNDTSYDLSGNKITISLEGPEYTFNLTPGYNFHFIIYENFEGERYVVTSN